MIKYTSNNQISIEEFILPFSGRLNKKNRWVWLANNLPWDKMVSLYSQNMSLKMGRCAIDPRVAIGSLIIKHMKTLSDEDTVEEIRENPYLQYFLGYKEYHYDQPFTPSLFVSFRRRLGDKHFEELTNRLVAYVKEEEAKKKHKKRSEKNNNNSNSSSGLPLGSTNKGHLIVDATVSPADIKYPTDLNLLNEARQKSELLIDLLHVPEKGKLKPRTYRRIAHKKYLSATKIRKKSKKTLRKVIGQQLRYVGRNLKTIEKMLDEKRTRHFPLGYKYQRLYWIIQELYRQQKHMYDTKRHQVEHRIVSISQPYVRPIVRGKAGREVEFGAKASLSLVDGYSYLHRISWDAYNESTDLKAQIEAYQKHFGHYPEWVSADKIYGTRENRAYMKSQDIRFSGVSLGRPKALTTELKKELKTHKKYSRQRSRVEGKFGEGKRKYDLGLVKAKRSDTSESWIGAVFFVMNIAYYLRVIFLSFLKNSQIWFKNIKIIEINRYMVSRGKLILYIIR
jgi:hypothetical protein